ncbi:hypothetical protein HHE06_12450 [Helicobacter heilmannii]|nr:hypothetical protein BN341_12230 [Helicobacter heilmannii ASB1.4]CRF51374.1 hypothetical protein HHE06_12450 [Helicobacter heilmannii]
MVGIRPLKWHTPLKAQQTNPLNFAPSQLRFAELGLKGVVKLD